VYSLIVTATEDSGGFSTSVEVGYFVLWFLCLCVKILYQPFYFCDCFSIFNL
jgi:hypothetical protein